MTPEARLYVALYTDEDVTNQLAALIRQRSHEAISALDIGMMERPDETHLMYAAEHGLTLFTYNERDYIHLAQQWARAGRAHAGILISDQFSLRQFGELLRRTLNFLNRIAADEMRNSVRYLSEFK